MKRFLLIASLATAIIACNSNGNNKVKAAVLNDSLRQIALQDTSTFTTVQWVDSTFKDLGKVKAGETVEITYVVKNTGDKPLIISSVSPGCGCTVAEKPEQPILPGEKDKIVAKFNSAGQSEGEHKKVVTVMANTKPETQTTLSFQVNVTK